MSNITVVVTGGRGYENRQHVFSVLSRLHKDNHIALLLHGGATGADALADEWAVENGVQTAVFAVTDRMWKIYGRAAGPRRNQAMLTSIKEIDLVVAFPGGNGTSNCVSIATSLKLPILDERVRRVVVQEAP